MIRSPSLSTAARTLRGASLLFLSPVALAAQGGLSGPTFSSEAGVYSESYSILGRAARRPASTTRLHLTPNLEWMGIQVSGSLLWSTEEQFTAQSTNRLYFAPRWSWGQVHAGDYVPEISRYTASTAQLRGGGFSLNPGRLRVAATMGRAQQATDASAFDAAQERFLAAGLVGWGAREGTFIELSALRAADKIAGSDSVSVAPQENVVAGIAGGLRLMGGRLTISGDAGGSLFSRDTRADTLALTLPASGGGLFTPRVSSRWDYAWNAQTRWSGRRGSLGAQFEYVGPGFSTLGNPYFQNDRREVRLNGSLRATSGRLHASGSLGRRQDNLGGDKRATTTRLTGSGTVVAITGAWLVSTATVMVNGLTRNPDLSRPPTAPDPIASDSFRLANVVLALSLTEQVRFRRWGMQQHLILSVSEQRVEDDSPRLGDALDAASRSVALEYGITLAEAYTFTLRPAYQSFTSASGRESFTSVTGGLSRRVAQSPLSLRLQSTYTPVGDGDQSKQDVTASYRVGESGQVSAQFRRVTMTGAQGYTESTASLRFTRRW